MDTDILDLENPQLQRYLVNGDPLLEADKKNKYLNVLLDYVAARKVDFRANTPADRHF